MSVVPESAAVEPVDLAGYRRRADDENLIRRFRTALGAPLGPVAQNLLRRVITQPDDDSWDEAHGLVVAPDVTLWAAVLTHTDYDVQVSPHYIAWTNEVGFVRVQRTRWTEVPTSDQIRQALRRTR